MPNTSTNTNCLNCGTAFVQEHGAPINDVHCYRCGQAKKEGRLSIIRLLKDGISSIFNLDGRLAHTLKDLFFTSKMTRAYIAGKRKFYVNPARLFIFSLILLVSLIVYLLKLDNRSLGADQIIEDSKASLIYDDFVEYTESRNLRKQNTTIDSLEAHLFEGVQSVDTDTFGIGTISLLSNDIDVDQYGITTYDIAHLSVPDIIKKYKIEDRTHQLVIGQFIRGITDPANLITTVVKNVTWAVLIALILLCLLLYVLYIRRRYYLIEHAVLILNGHSALFLTASVALILYKLLNYFEIVGPSKIGLLVGLLLLLGAILQLFAMKNYYQQGIIKTFIKWSVVCFSYLFIFTISFILVALISALLY